ncbi:redox-sensing transcriptional repressor Rex [candidate division KSB3 bacterium]|uniref:Redox-sensing transcriptional repressor Rex n=1 Tax=candidate division KSB3 bacterium TaxID=2044937 RepID=A0A9D5Q6G4_9BACT|nr:redox-sensing transcriptional repressor Rex [candidate division KSB3 bacterium]MBD3325725.1 redox-sensing transcriptional repressor Rex [candidate division KSB3 bacterium]
MSERCRLPVETASCNPRKIMKADERISEFTIYRLSIYKRCLEELEHEQIKTISSKDFAARFGLNSAQVRKDLAYFGEFGIRGMGYPVKTLKQQLLNILGLAESSAGEKRWKTIIIGTATHLGAGLLHQHETLRTHGFEMIAAFASSAPSPDAGSAITSPETSAIPLYPLNQLETIIAADPPDIAMLATAEDQAQEIANRLVTLGIQAILNFVPVQLLVPSHVKVRAVDLIAELQSLTYHLHHQAQEKQPPSDEEKSP